MLLRAAVLLATACLPAIAVADEIDTRHYLYIEADGSVSVPADHADIVVTFAQKGKTPEEAIDGSSKVLKTLFDNLAPLGIKAGDGLQTNQYTFETVYIVSPDVSGYSVPNPDRDKFDGYRASNSFTVTVKDISKLGGVLTMIAKTGATVSSVNYLTFNEVANYDLARTRAAERAHAKAEIYAKSLGLTLGGILSMREGTGYSVDSMTAPDTSGESADLMIPASPSSIATPLATPTVEYAKGVSIKWEILDR